MDDRIRIETSGHVADVMLDRADKFNALDWRMFVALAEAADFVARDKNIRAVVLHGAGDNFCAGIDLEMFADTDRDFHTELATPQAPSPANRFQRAAYAWRELAVPVIAALEGVTFGGGFQIAMGADVRFAGPGLRMSVMESKWGLIPDMAISTTVRGILSPDRLKELAWTARTIGADEALKSGLVTEVCDDPLAAAKALAAECAGKSPQAVRGVKRLVNEGWQQADADSLALEARIQAGILGGKNQAEAIQANLEKRPPEFED